MHNGAAAIPDERRYLKLSSPGFSWLFQFHGLRSVLRSAGRNGASISTGAPAEPTDAVMREHKLLDTSAT